MVTTKHWFAVGILGCAIISALTLLRANEEVVNKNEQLVKKNEKPAREPAQCTAAADPYFNEELWPKVIQRSCLTCHKAGGDAEDSEFVLQDPTRAQGAAQTTAIRHNHALLIKLAKLKDGDESVLLQKVTGGLDHGGGVILPRESIGYRTLSEFVRRTVNPENPAPSSALPLDLKPQPPLFAGVTMLDDRRLLRRVTLSLAGRLPTETELEQVTQNGLTALPKLLDGLMNEEAFYARLREGFNDIFLTRGYGDGPVSALAYDHFSKTRNWVIYGKLEDISEEKIRTRKKDELTRDYNESLLGEPMKLVEYIVRNERPFTEIVTADYIMVTPYSALGYGIFEELKDLFKDPGDPNEYIPVKLKALVGREKRQNQESATGFYPHAGLLSTFQYMRRYPTTETNRNRLRARMYFQHFLGIDALELAARVSDAAAVTAKFEIPTMQAAECVVCHKTLDPVASCFQDYYHFEGVYGRRKEGWYKDMFQAGLDEEKLPDEERWRALQWLGERTAKDPRFAVAMVEHVYYILTGRKVLLPPKDLDDPQYAAKHRAYREQRCLVQSAAEHFAANKFNLKGVFKELILSDFYRADGLAAQKLTDAQRAALDDIGVVRMLAPEQVERKIKAVFGSSWGKLNGQNGMLYGGIDSDQVTERAADPSGAMGALQRNMANDVAAKHVIRDFALPAKERVLFADIEPDVLPGSSPEADEQIRKQIAALHERVLGNFDTADSADVERTFKLFGSLVQEAKATKGLDKLEIYHARNKVDNAPPDPHYTIRAWRGVVTYLLRRHEFLYE
jgi:hypothetical protein